MQILDDIKQIASSDRGYKNYKEKLRSINPPCVPFLGEYVREVVLLCISGEISDHASVNGDMGEQIIIALF